MCCGTVRQRRPPKAVLFSATSRRREAAVSDSRGRPRLERPSAGRKHRAWSIQPSNRGPSHRLALPRSPGPPVSRRGRHRPRCRPGPAVAGPAVPNRSLQCHNHNQLQITVTITVT